MKKIKSSLIVILVFVMIFTSFAGCKKATYIDEESVISGTSEQAGSNENDSSSPEEDKGQQLITSSGSSDSSNFGGASTTIKDSIKIKNGSTPIEKNVDYKGKTLVFVSAWQPNSGDVKEFEKTYNCKLDIRILDFNLYTQQAAALVNGGTKIDIGYVFEGYYPQILISGLWQPLQDRMTTADLVDGKNTSAPAIDLEKSKRFVWNNNLYAVTYYYSTYTGVLFYNKKMLNDLGAKDPMEYYKAGNWNYDTFLSFARSVTDANSDIYFGASGMYSGWLQTNNTGYIKYKNGVPTENLSDPAVYDALKLVCDMAIGQNKVLKLYDNARDAFIQGKTVAYKDYISDSRILRSEAKNSEVFGKNADNVGRILLPTGPNNKDNIPTTVAVDGYGASVGSEHPEAAILWAKLLAKNTKARNQEAWGLSDSEWKEFIEEPLKKDLIRSYGGFATSSTNMNGITSDIESKVYLGTDITSLLNRYRQQVKNCINVSMKEQG